MPTLAEENKKILRRSLDVLVGMDIPFVEISSVTATGNYSGSSEEVNGTMQEPILMDLSNGGFKNDGLAVPLGDDTDGFVSEIGTNLVLTVTLEESSNNRIVVVGYIGGNIHKWEFSGSGSSRTITIPGNTERIIVNRVICGESFWFDNSNLVSCNLQLRAVETKIDNPELQMSEIEIEGYEPNDITDIIGYIGTGYPIYYTSGYPGDMAPMRKFYLGEPIDFEDKIVKIKGYDATYKLDTEFEGVYIGIADQNGNGGITKYFNTVSTMITNSGVEHEYTNEYDNIAYEDGGPLFIPNIPKRSIIAQMVNLFRYTVFNLIPGTVYLPVYINYVDAGMPKMWTGKDESKYKILEWISKPNIIVDPAVATVEMNVLASDVATSATVDSVTVTGSRVIETSDPFYSFSTSSGTVTWLSPYSYRIKANGKPTISGRQIYTEDRSGYDNYSPLIVSSGGNGVTITLDDFNCINMYNGGDGFLYGDWTYLLGKLMTRSNISYEFEYRGDPKLQPRDYIRADIDGSGTLVDMTIDTIELKHEGGGTSSTIVARKGFI